jgi:DNA-binding NarL/FixJ family response regulator
LTQSENEADLLTEREIDVLKLVAKGFSNPQISKELSVTVNTVKSHIKSILDKLNVENRTQAATYALQHGLVERKTGNCE